MGSTRWYARICDFWARIRKEKKNKAPDGQDTERCKKIESDAERVFKEAEGVFKEFEGDE